jgi:DNA mismatch repair protein MutS
VQVKDTVRREELRRALDGILDLERLLSRVTLETANPRDVLALAASLGKIPQVRAVLAGIDRVSRVPASRLATLHKLIDELADLREKIDHTLVPEPPLTLSDGGVIAAGVDKDLDELRDLSRNSKQYLAQVETARARTHGHWLAQSKVQFDFWLLHRDFEGEPASFAGRLRAQADAGECRALHDSRTERV